MAQKEFADLMAIAGHLIFTKTRVAAYYKLPPTRYDYVTDAQRMADLYEQNAMYAGISDMVDGKPIDLKLYVLKDPIKPDEWARGFEEGVRSMNNGELPNSFRSGLRANFEHVARGNFSRPSAYLEISIGNRDALKKTALSDNPVTQAVEFASDFIDRKVLSSRDQEVSDDEVKAWKEYAHRFDVVMEGQYGAEPVEGGIIASIYRRALYPAQQAPTLPGYDRWGSGDIIYLSEAEIDKHPKYNLVKNVDGEGYQATLAFQKFPRAMRYPTGLPWIVASNFHDTTNGKYTFWASFTLIGANHVRKDLVNAIKVAKDEQKDAAQAGLSPISVEEKLSLATELESYMAQSNDPWVYGQYFITVTAKTKKELEENILSIIQDYRGRNILLSYPTGRPQYKLLLSSLPGGERFSKRWTQRQPVSIIGGGAPTVNSSVGD